MLPRYYPFNGGRGALYKKLYWRFCKFYIAVLAPNVKMTDLLVVAAGFALLKIVEGRSREVWKWHPTGTHLRIVRADFLAGAPRRPMRAQAPTVSM